MLRNFVPQQKQKPVDLTNHGRIAFNTASHVTPEVFFGAQINGEDEQVSHGAQRQMVMKPAPGAPFKMVQAQIVFGALEVLLDVPSGTAEAQTACFGGQRLKLSQIIMIRLLSLWPVHH